MKIAAELAVLSDVERSCLERYLDLLVETLGNELEIFVYGSVARGESWTAEMPIRSDLDLLVVTPEPVPDQVATRLLDATMPLFLESGRQLGPLFKTKLSLAEGLPELAEALSRDAIRVYPG